MSESERTELYRKIGMGGLKYYLLKVDPKKRMMFNPEESIELNGNTGPFIQYAHARIRSLIAKSGMKDLAFDLGKVTLVSEEKEIIKQLSQFPVVITEAAREHSPALIANYTFELVKLYNSFYQTVPILIEADDEVKKMRLVLSDNVAKVIALSMRLLGIDVPDKM
jgi:arginyl-tRNA synthetase